MTHAYQPSLEHLHLNFHGQSDRRSHRHESTTTFTALLHAAQSAEINSPAAIEKYDVTPNVLTTKRRLRNRVSCRKTRLKRKLHHHALEILARDRQTRHRYLTQVYLDLGSDPHRDNELFREFAARSLHYALVDPEYSGWFDASHYDQATPRSRSELERDDKDVGYLPTKSNVKRVRRASDNDVSSALGNNSQTSQTSLFEQWRVIVDGLQNIDMQLLRMDENEIATGIFDRHCYWKFVGVCSAKMKRFGEITAVAVSGITNVRFYDNHVEQVSISNVQREDNVPFDCKISITNDTTEAC